MNDVVSEFIEAMRAAEVGPKNPSDIVADDVPTYYDIEGDKKKGRGSYCLADDGDGFGYGWMYNHKTGECINWHTKAKRGISDEEKASHRARVAAAKVARDAKIKAAYEVAALRASDIWNGADREGVTEYLTRKGVGLNGARIHKGMVCVPMYRDARLVGLQFISDDGSKVFLKDTEKKGAYHSMRGPDMSVIRICEGFATGAAIRECWPDNPVIVAFDAGNLKPVAVAMSKRYPDATLVICGDNDQWRDGGNIGLEKAQQAAVAVGGAAVMVPPFDADDADQRTDWDDYLRAFGVDATRDAMTVPDVVTPEPMDTPFDGDDVVERDMRPHLDQIRPLGIDVDTGKYLFFPLSSGRIVSLSATQLSQIANLLTLVADLNFWEIYYGLDDGKPNNAQIALHASVELINECDKLGVFRSDDSRSVGAWEDNGTYIVNTGKRIVGDGIDMPTSTFKGDKIYTSGVNVIDLNVDPLTAVETQQMYDICHHLVWKRSCYAKLFAGWLVVAGVGGALHWRPHIWITGRSGSGKSTVMDGIVKNVLSGIAVVLDGSTTEAGVRKFIGTSSRPFIADEFESETMKDRTNAEAIVGLFRKASSGGVVGNANGTFNARSCACFSAINPNLTETADLARITLLELEVNTSRDRKAHFEKLVGDMSALFKRGFDKRLFKFAFENIETLVANIDTFKAAATTMFGNARTADQLAPMLAGAYMLTSNKLVTVADAKAWIEQDDWEWFTSIGQENDSEKLVSHIMTSRIGYDTMGMRREGAIGDLIETVVAGSDGAADISRGLRAYGIRIDGDYVLIANNGHNMTRILRDTPWVPWSRTLGDYAGSHNYGNKTVYFMRGVSSKVIAIPLSGLSDVAIDHYDHGAVSEVELDF